MEKTILIKGAEAIVTCDGQDRVFRNCDMLIRGPKIEKIAPDIKDPADEVISAKGRFVYPGLINTHHHFFQTFVRNLTTIDYPNMTVMDWITRIYQIFQRIDDDVIFYSSLTAMADLVKHGCTTAFDHQYCFTTATGKRAVDRQMEAASMIGLRYHAGRGANTLPASAGSSMPDAMVETTEEFLADCERLVGRYHDPKPFAMSRIIPSPCQPINCYKETFETTIDFCRKRGLRMHTHLGEGENDMMEERWGMRTLAWCEDIGFIGPDVWIAHGWELRPEEYGVLAKHETGVSHCPTPAVLGGFPILPMREMIDAGVCISLGCDGSATNDGSSLLDAMRLAWMMQAFYSKERGGCISPYEMLKIATVNGAKTLGCEELGSLEEGKGADLFMIDAGTLELAGALHDPKNLLARTAVLGPVDLTMVNGRVVFEKGELKGVDERALAREGEAVCTRVLREPCDAFHNL